MLHNLPAKIRNSKGFTLIELIVVIAILGVLAAVLIAVIDPLDKINQANDSGVISTVAQIGKAQDSYAANNNNFYAPPATQNDFDALVTVLNTSGEIKYTTVTEPSTQYVYTYYSSANCVTATPNNCTTYVIGTNVRSKKYPAGTYYIYANGKGCTTTTVPSATSTCP